MSDLSTTVLRCCQCHAPLPLERTVQHVARCNFCGTDHRVSSAKANEERELHKERRLNGLVAPYAIAPLIGFFGYLAYRDFLHAPYEGQPAMIVAFAFLVIGLLGFRMAAVLGLGIVGLAGVLKPFVRAIPSWDAGYMSPTSETAFYYLVPGALAAFVAFLFFASLRVRELRPALHALVPRVGVVALGLIGVLCGYFIVGESIVQVARQYQSELLRFETLALKACDGALEEDLAAALIPAWSDASDASAPKNSITISCGAARGSTSADRDPLHIDQWAQLKRTLDGRISRLHRGAGESMREYYQALAKSDYLVVVDSAAEHRGYLVSTASGKVLRETQVLRALNGSLGAQYLISQLRGQVPAMPSLVGTSPSPKVPVVPPEASYVHHSTVVRGTSTWFFGIVTNTGKVPLSKPEVQVIFKDAQGQELGTTHGFGAYALLPGESCAVTVVDSDAPDFDSTEFELNLRADTNRAAAQGLFISEKKVRTKENGPLEISGKVKNDGKTPARFVEVYLSVFDGDDKLIDTRSSFAKSDGLAPGDEARFLMTLYGTRTEDKALPRYELAVRAQVDTR